MVVSIICQYQLNYVGTITNTGDMTSQGMATIANTGDFDLGNMAFATVQSVDFQIMLQLVPPDTPGQQSQQLNPTVPDLVNLQERMVHIDLLSRLKGLGLGIVHPAVDHWDHILVSNKIMFRCTQIKNHQPRGLRYVSMV